MKRRVFLAAALAVIAVLSISAAKAEILAMLNYETKSEDSLKALKNPIAPPAREEGIAIMDVDPNSANYGQILMTIPLPGDLIAHHIFYNKDLTKGYVTSLGKPELRVIDMTRFPYRLKTVSVPDCAVGEDVIFSDDNKTFYVTCMGSSAVIVGDAVADKPTHTIHTPEPYPHGIALHEGIDRLLVTSTVDAATLGDARDMITVIRASTNEVLPSLRASNKEESPAGEAPVEILFVPGSNPPIAYITNMFGHSLWGAVWNADTQDFDMMELFDFQTVEAGMPLEIYFNRAVDRLYVTTASPGHLHVFDISEGPTTLNLLKTYPTGEGAHHVSITPDERLAFVQNTLLNLPGLSDGSITVIDLENEEVIGNIETLKNAGYNPNLIVLLPEWYHPAGH
jgi:DNA-binding beta-propeller fold protein YncE